MCRIQESIVRQSYSNRQSTIDNAKAVSVKTGWYDAHYPFAQFE